MPTGKLGIGGFELLAFANPRGMGASLAFGGKVWEKAIAALRKPRAAGPPVAAAPLERRAATDETPEAQALRREIESVGWYHSMDLGHGVATAGQFDHRPFLPLYKLPESLAGLRVLDVATFDGFWAFEFERRGAAEVVALDLEGPAELDWPPKVRAAATAADLALKFGRGFEIAKRCLRSKVERVACSVYDLAPSTRGMFDVVHAGDFLLHINSPVRALQRIASVTQGYAIISEVYHPDLDRPGAKLVEYLGGQNDVTWWRFSLGALQQMILDAGFREVQVVSTFKYGQRGAAHSMHHVVFKAIK